MCAHEGEALLRNHGFSHLGSRFQALYVNHVSMQLIQKVRHAFSIPPGLLVRNLFLKSCAGDSQTQEKQPGRACSQVQACSDARLANETMRC